MMKNKTKRIIVNGVVLAALAAVGVTAYQLGTSPVKEEEIPEEIQIKSELPKEETNTDDQPVKDADTDRVTASV